MSDAPAPIEAVQAAAVERALVDGAVARDHLALVGALEPARRTRRRTERQRDGRDAVGPTAAALLAVSLLRDGDDPARLPAPGDEPEPAIEGAAVAHRRFGVAADRAAALAGVPVASVRASLD